MMPIIKSVKTTPLPSLLRPSNLNDIVGQDHLIGPGQPLRLMADKNRPQSVILWGPAGIGKTTLCQVLASEINANFHKLNATNATVKDIRSLIDLALKDDRVTIVMVDEIHRFSKSQQDVLLPVVENGTIILFGATTEKPKFAVNSTILSRCLVFEVKPLDPKAMVKLMCRIKKHYKDNGKSITIDDNAAKRLITLCSGDARKLIVIVETIVEILSDDGHVTLDLVNLAMPDKHAYFDASGNEHFDFAHAMQEAQQNSDADAAIYWLASWVASGEDPAYIARRILVAAFEDGGSDVMAIVSAFAAHYAVERVGLPECLIPMSHAVITTAQSDRRKIAYNAISEAMSDVNNKAMIRVPPQLRAGTSGYVSPINKKYVHDNIQL